MSTKRAKTWSESEDKFLLNMARDKIKIKEIAAAIGKDPASVNLRMQKLAARFIDKGEQKDVIAKRNLVSESLIDAMITIKEKEGKIRPHDVIRAKRFAETKVTEMPQMVNNTQDIKSEKITHNAEITHNTKSEKITHNSKPPETQNNTMMMIINANQFIMNVNHVILSMCCIEQLNGEENSQAVYAKYIDEMEKALSRMDKYSADFRDIIASMKK